MVKYKQSSDPGDTGHRATGSQDIEHSLYLLTGTVEVFL